MKNLNEIIDRFLIKSLHNHIEVRENIKIDSEMSYCCDFAITFYGSDNKKEIELIQECYKNMNRIIYNNSESEIVGIRKRPYYDSVEIYIETKRNFISEYDYLSQKKREVY